jgi:drug/metabolite transporter (DMT)-like permease
VNQTTPVQLAFLRYSWIIAIYILIWPKRQYSGIDALPIIGLGIVFFGIFPWTFSAALQHIPASRGAAGAGACARPLLTLGIASAVGYERITHSFFRR